MDDSSCPVVNNLSVDEQVAEVKASIARRAKDLEDDLAANILLEERLISGRLSSVKGMKKHLSHAKLKKAWYEQQEVRDPLGHDTVTRASLHKQYSL